MPKYGQRIRTPSAAGTGAGPGAAATVTMGPDFGTTNQKVELHLSSTYQNTVQYPMTEELSLHPTTFSQTYNTLTEELHIGSVEQQTYRTLTEEQHIGPVTQQQTYPTFNEELHVGPETQKQTYPTLNEELHIAGTVNGPPQVESVATVITTATSVCALTGVSTIQGQVLLAFISQGGGTPGAYTHPAGWTTVKEGGNVTASMNTYFRVIAAGDPSSWTWTNNGANGTQAGTILALSAADTVTFVNGTTFTTGNSTVMGTGAWTATKPNTLTCVGGALSAATSATLTISSPYVQRSAMSQGGVAAALAHEVGTRVQMTSGAGTSATMNTGLVAGGAWIALVVSVNSTSRVIA